MCFVKFLSFLNICTAIVVIIFQIATLSRFYHQEMEKIGIGIWGGLIYLAAGVLNWIGDNEEKKNRTYIRWGGITAVVSLLTAIVMIGIFGAAVANLKDDELCTIHTQEYQCDINRALDGVMLFAGGFALIVNVSLSIIMCYCTHDDKY